MEIEQLNKLIAKMQVCESHIETYKAGKKSVLQFKELWPSVRQVIAFFHSRQLKPHDKIGIIGTNSLDWVVIDLACIAAGIITLPFDPAIKYNVEELLAEYELPFILTNIEAYKTCKGVHTFEDVCQEKDIPSAEDFTPVKYKPEDVLTYKFTSGSTQRPKVMGAMKQSVDAAITFVQQIFQHGNKDKLMIFLPLHTYQQRYWIYSAILFDFDIVVIPKEYAFHAIKLDKPTVIMGIPFFFETMMKNFLADMEFEEPMTEELTRQKFHEQFGGRIRYLWTGSAPLGSDTLAFYEKMKMPLYQGYGMNEICIVSKNYLGNNKTGSVGKILPGKAIKFDWQGQMLVKSEYPVNTCYYGAKEEDNKATFLNDGFVATGDLGYIDDDGYLFITGRIKELIVLANAVKIHPAPVEKKVETSAIIKHCVVYGDKHPYLVALIVPESTAITDSEIKLEISRTNELLKPQEQICNFITLRKEFTMENKSLSGQNKILRNNVIEEYRQELENLYSN
ncbi:MAG: AMP-binding protein [Ferruginibacter sp.]